MHGPGAYLVRHCSRLWKFVVIPRQCSLMALCNPLPLQLLHQPSLLSAVFQTSVMMTAPGMNAKHPGCGDCPLGILKCPPGSVPRLCMLLCWFQMILLIQQVPEQVLKDLQTGVAHGGAPCSSGQPNTLHPNGRAPRGPSASNSPKLITVFFSDSQVISFNLGTIRGRSRRYLILIRSKEMARAPACLAPASVKTHLCAQEGEGGA